MLVEATAIFFSWLILYFHILGELLPFQFYFKALPDKADNDVLLELTDQKLNIGNPQYAKDSIAEIEFEDRLDQDINQIRTSTMTDEHKHVLNDGDDRESVAKTHVDATIEEEDTHILGEYRNYKIMQL